MERDLYNMNPWWKGAPQRRIPRYRRTIYNSLYDKVTRRLYRAIAVRGPRQVGKTTLQSQMIDDLTNRRRLASPAQILRVQFDDLKSLALDDPIVAIAVPLAIVLGFVRFVNRPARCPKPQGKR